jgi:hypothetical protein
MDSSTDEWVEFPEYRLRYSKDGRVVQFNYCLDGQPCWRTIREA